MIDNVLRPPLNVIDYLDSLWFQHDGATCHTARQTMDMSRQFIRNQIIALGYGH